MYFLNLGLGYRVISIFAGEDNPLLLINRCNCLPMENIIFLQDDTSASEMLQYICCSMQTKDDEIKKRERLIKSQLDFSENGTKIEQFELIKL